MSKGARPEIESDLLDISEEDGDSWLLNNLPNEGVSVLANSSTGCKNGYFNCSPLQIPRSNHRLPARPSLSPIGEVMGNKNMEQPNPSIVTGNVDKENVRNKFELSKLSVERQQMKRKKKTAGFNARKSLAWDRAFFTEEGVLDSVELSIITGNDCQTGGEMLPTIQEERRESILVSSCSSDSSGLRAIEENLLKELPVNSKNKEKKIVGGVLPKNASPSKAPSSLGQRKLLTAQDARSSSKSSGSPRPLSSSSSANAHMAKAQNKELRVSKVSATVKKSTQAPSKVKQIPPTQSSGNSQRSLGSTSSSKKTSSAQINTKSSLARKSLIPKPSVKQARRNAISTASNSQHSVAMKSDDNFMTTSDLALPVLGHESNFHGSSSSNISVPQSSYSGAENMQSAVPRVPRPSGLRMPSPSIGFFSQSKYQSQGSLENSAQALPRSDSATNYSSISIFNKSQVAGKVPRVNTKATTGNTSHLGSSTGFSAPSGLLQPQQEKKKSESRSTLEKELKLPCNSISSQITRMAECIAKKDTDFVCVELNKCVGKSECMTEIIIRTDEESCAQVTHQELGPREEGVVQVKNSPHPEAFPNREEESRTPVSSDKAVPVGDIVQPNEFSVLNTDASISETNGADASESCSSPNPKTENLKESKTHSSDDTYKINVQDTKLEKRPDPLVVKPPPNAVPFSDEWLAALEAAGEEILTLKTGPVQHSPTEKHPHEPGPWSPVKRKNNQGVGPFDCTKFTNKGLPPAFD